MSLLAPFRWQCFAGAVRTCCPEYKKRTVFHVLDMFSVKSGREKYGCGLKVLLLRVCTPNYGLKL